MTEELIPFAMSLSDDDPRVRLIHQMIDDDALSKELGDDWRNLDCATACELSANKKNADFAA